MADKKSPIKEKPLRQAGQSVSEQLQDLIFDKILSYYFVATVVWLLALYEWIQHWRQAPPAPVFMTVAAIVVTVIAVVRGLPLVRRARHHKQGMEGEKVVGEYLDRLRGKGYRVYHDIPGKDGNVDHVIICDRGVFTVETKTISKPAKGDPVIVFDGKTLIVDDFPANDRPIAQALAQARNIKTVLKENTGFDYEVQPTVVYPGWYVQNTPGARSQVWVLNPKALHKFIENQPITLTPDRIKVAASNLAKFVRNYSQG